MGIQVRILCLALVQFFAFGSKLRCIHVRATGWIIDAVENVKALSRNKVVAEFLAVLDVLYSEEDEAESDCQYEKNRNQWFLAGLRRPRRHSHGKTASQQHDGVEAAQRQTQRVAAHSERREVHMAVQRVCQ